MKGKVKKSSLIWLDVCPLKNFVKGGSIDETTIFFFFFFFCKIIKKYTFSVKEKAFYSKHCLEYIDWFSYRGGVLIKFSSIT